MSVPIQGAGQQGYIQQPTGDQQAVKELTQQLNEIAQDAMVSLQDLSEELSGKVAVKDPNKAKKKDSVEGDRGTHDGMEELAGEMSASVSAQDELERKKKKRKKLEGKLKMMGGILAEIDTSALEEEDQKEIETFQKNLNTMNRLNRRLNQLDQEEEHLSGLLQKHSR